MRHMMGAMGACLFLGALAGCGSDVDSDVTKKLSKKRPTEPAGADADPGLRFRGQPGLNSRPRRRADCRARGMTPTATPSAPNWNTRLPTWWRRSWWKSCRTSTCRRGAGAAPAPAGEGIYTIEGQFVTVDEGNAAMRMIIGFGAGGTEIKTHVQAYAIEPAGKRLLAEATLDAESSSAPGLAATLPIGGAISGIGQAAAISTGIGVVREMNTDVHRRAPRIPRKRSSS